MVYFVRADAYVKIGVANNIQSRMSALQTGCPQELECILLLRGSYLLEAEIHDRFWSNHHRGEWFVWSEQLASFVREKRASGDDLSGITRVQAQSAGSVREFGEFVRELRETAGLSLQAVADMLEISKTAAAAVETGSNPSLDVMRRHLQLFGAKYVVE